MNLKSLCLIGLLALVPLNSQAAMTKMDSAELSKTTGQLRIDLGKSGAGVVLPGNGPFLVPPGQNPLYGAPGQSPLFQFVVHHH
mgnify:CR=1 FL=1|jgi:hypothetical protein